MDLPKFLIADNSSLKDDLFVVHTEYPRFVLNISNDEVHWLEEFDKEVQAWAFLDKKILLEKAEEADEYRKSGKPLGALHGLPVAIKDIIGTYDMPTECGTISVSYTHLTLPTNREV